MFTEKKNMKQENTGGLTNRIIHSTKISGEITSNTDFRIDGEIEGAIKVNGKLVLGESSVVNGKIQCGSADIGGKFKGSVVVNDVLAIKSTANIEGEVTTKKLVVEHGAIFNATCMMNVSSKKESMLLKSISNKSSVQKTA